MITLTNPRNPHVKQARQLQQRKVRDETGLFVVEGIRHVGEAVSAGATIEYLCYAPDLLESGFARELVEAQAAAGRRVYALAPDVFRSLAEKDNPQGLLAVVRRPRLALTDLQPARHNWLVAVAKPQDPGNIGTIMRTVDAVGASGLLLLDGGADPTHPNAVRASLGALFWMPVVSAAFGDFLAWARGAGYQLCGTSEKGALDYRAAAYRRPAILLLGSERDGLTAEQEAACDLMVRLPMAGRVTSLNLAVAAGVLLYAMQARFERGS
ncbi:MAG: RNA methyltransferase [Anaerolineales bacterium]|nr:RNA methyltransferase [Anaerolineales bacterium]